jgi:hypothetical protein
MELLDVLEPCRLHKNREEGCLSPTFASVSTADRIAVIKVALVRTIFEEMRLWHKFYRLSRPNEAINVQFVTLSKQ